MNAPYFSYPWFIEPWKMGVTFLVALSIFHVVFVWVRPLTITGWRRADYFYLSGALIGILLSVDTNRQFVTQSYIASAAILSEARYAELVSRLQFGQSGAVCRVFVRTESSPPADEFKWMQTRYDDECAWFKRLNDALPAHAKDPQLPIDLVSLAGTFPQGADEGTVTAARDAAKAYNDSLATIDSLKRDLEDGELRIGLRFLGPFLLTVALALRLTKVTGELALDRRN